MVGEGLAVSCFFHVRRVRGGPGLASPATAGAGRGRERVQRRRGVECVLKALAGGSRGCAGRRGGRWPEGARGALSCDVHGMLADPGRAISGEARASMATWPVLGGVGVCGGDVWQGGQGRGRRERGGAGRGGDMAGMAMS